MDRASADYMGMLARSSMPWALQDALESRGAKTRVLSALEVQKVGRTLHSPSRHTALGKGTIGDFGAGTGNPFFTTDTAASFACDGDRGGHRDEGHPG